MIVDNELNQVLVNPLPPGVRLHAIIDACHSGSMLDLECRAEFKRGFANWQNEYRKRPKVYKVSGPSFSGIFGVLLPNCTSHQIFGVLGVGFWPCIPWVRIACYVAWLVC